MITIALNDARATDWHEVQLLQQAIFNADRRGDFEGAPACGLIPFWLLTLTSTQGSIGGDSWLGWRTVWRA
jgi:hypothetical protein